MTLLDPITTDRLILRPRQPADAEALWEVYRDSAVMRFLGGVRADSFEQFQTQLAERTKRERAYAPGLALRVMEDRTTGAILGHCGVVPVQRTGPEIELVYHLAKRYWSRGYATEAALAIRDFAMDTLALDRIIGLVDPDNLASKRILDNIGMRFIEQTTRYYDRAALVYELTRALFTSLPG